MATSQTTYELMYDSIKAARRVNQPSKFHALLDKDNDEIEKDLLGAPAVDCLIPTHETRAAIPVGSPFLSLAVPIQRILKRFRGIYSIK